jgi:hypothetical protein
MFQDEHFNLDEQYCIQDVTEVKSVDTSTVAMETKQVCLILFCYGNIRC